MTRRIGRTSTSWVQDSTICRNWLVATPSNQRGETIPISVLLFLRKHLGMQNITLISSASPLHPPLATLPRWAKSRVKEVLRTLERLETKRSLDSLPALQFSRRLYPYNMAAPITSTQLIMGFRRYSGEWMARPWKRQSRCIRTWSATTDKSLWAMANEAILPNCHSSHTIPDLFTTRVKFTQSNHKSADISKWKSNWTLLVQTTIDTTSQ